MSELGPQIATRCCLELERLRNQLDLAPVSDAKEREARLLAEAREIIEEALDEDAQDGYRLAPSLEADMRGFLNASSPDYRPVSGEDR